MDRRARTRCNRYILMGFNCWTMDIVDSEWVVKVVVLLVWILLIIHFSKPCYSYFEINIRNGKVGRLLIFLYRLFNLLELSI